MDWNLFWTAFGAIGGTFGALATAVAVIVALWQTKYSQKKKVKLKFHDRMSTVGGIGGRNFVGISITNIGNRDVIVQSWGIKLYGKEFVIITQAMNDSVLNLLNVSLPHILKIEESITLYYPIEQYVIALTNFVREKDIQPSKRVRFFFRDSTGKEHIVKTTKPASFYISEH